MIRSIFVLLLAGCQLSHESSLGLSDIPHDPALLTGELAFETRVEASEVPDVDVLAVDEAMQTFVGQRVAKGRSAAVRLRRLVDELADGGFFDGFYDAHRTQTASETFHSKRGNCLSYTNMFVALARASGIGAQYQIVDVPPVWDASAGMLIRNKHINVVVSGRGLELVGAPDRTIDFNEQWIENDEFGRAAVSDVYALSLFDANLAVEALRQDKMRLGFAHLKKAILASPEIADLWVNLGAFYGRMDQPASALAAFEVAYFLDDGNTSALSGLARANRALGRDAAADAYAVAARERRDGNPYYHFALAQAAYEQGRFDDSLTAIDRAISIEGRVGRFHFMRGLAARELGDEALAASSFEQAVRFGAFEAERVRYAPNLRLSPRAERARGGSQG